MNAYFPYDNVREEQDKLLDAVGRAVKSQGTLVAHAPTGLGKTAAALSPTLKYAIENDKTIVFMTSRHTQHKLALETLKKIKARHQLTFEVVNLVGKKWLCLQTNSDRLRSKDFSDYCKTLREDKQCVFYENLKQGDDLSHAAKSRLIQLKRDAPMETDELKAWCAKDVLCPYEMTILLAKKARVIVTDYQYLFNPSIADTFLQKIGKQIEDLILIVDEAHNLPDRTKEAASERLSTITIQRAITEAEKYNYEEQIPKLKKLLEQFKRLGLTIEEHMNERYLEKEDIIRMLTKVENPNNFVNTFERLGEAVREEQQSSYIAAIATFFKTWLESEDDGYTRIFSESTFKDEDVFTIHYKCLDPSVITGPVLNNAHSSILMSGTFTPTRMYKDLLGVLKAEELILKSPFPKENKLSLIIPKTSTKFTTRSDGMYREIADHCSKIVDLTPGNSAIFFPSYYLLKEVSHYMRTNKKLFIEQQNMSKDDKKNFLEDFKKEKKQGAILMGVITGNFGEGIDLPGDELKTVIVVGLPLQKPTLETKALIRYFDMKYAKGWDYGYTFPAFNKTLQSAGRCIRTENDRGVVVFLEERYADERYIRCFPDDWNIKVTLLYENMIRKFFASERPDRTLEDFS